MCQTAFSVYSAEQLRLRSELRKLYAVIKADELDRVAAELEALLAAAWDAESRAAIEAALRLLEAGGDGAVSSIDVESVLRALKEKLATAFPAAVEAGMIEQIGLAYEKGFLAVEYGAGIRFNLVDRRALDWLERFHVYPVRQHYDQAIREKVEDLGRQVIEQGLGRFEAGALFQKELGAKLGQSQSYFSGYANNVVTRSSEFGRLDSYRASGVTRYQIQAVIDRRTSTTCKSLHGRIFRVEAAVNLRERLLATDDPEEVKRISPWLKPEEAAQMTDAQLEAAGVLMPPFHFNCRTRTVVYTG